MFELDLKGRVAACEVKKGEKVFWAEGIEMQKHKGIKEYAPPF